MPLATRDLITYNCLLGSHDLNIMLYQPNLYSNGLVRQFSIGTSSSGGFLFLLVR